MTVDLALSPLYRIDGQEHPALPGLLVQMPPAAAVRIRAQDRLAVYLLLLGNAVISASDYMKLAQDASDVFYKTGGSLTNALRAATDSLNQTLLERNMSTSGVGQYANGWLTLAAVRDSQCTLSMSGPMHAYWFGRSQARHIHEPNAAGRGLGMSQKASIYFAQVALSAGDRMILYGRAPAAWESALDDARPSSLDAMRRRLSAITRDDLNAVLIQATDGLGNLRLLDGIATLTEEKKQEETPPPVPSPNLPLPPKQESTPEPVPAEEPAADEAFPAHVLQPSAYAIPPQHEETDAPLSTPQKTAPREFPASIPRAKPKPEPVEEAQENEEPLPESEENAGAEETIPEKLDQPEMPLEPSESARQAARTLAGGIRSFRQLGETLGEKLRNFLPRLLPNPDVTEATTVPSTGLMAAMAVLIPLVVVTVLVVAYLSLGRSQQYDLYLRQAIQTREQALALNNPVEQRKAWENVLANVARAEEHRQTPDTASLRSEAEGSLDQLLGVTRMQFNPAFSMKPGITISRMTVSNGELYMLNAESGAILRAFPAPGGRGFQMDTAFRCERGTYGNVNVGPLVDILPLPSLNFVDASVLGIDANGNLLYCAPTRVPHAASLPTPDTNWNRVTGFELDGEILYVLDATARAAWVYNGKNGAFTDRPYFFFGQQTPTQDVIDFIVSGDEMYMLHSDGRVSTCSYSRITTSASDCRDPLPFQNPFDAYGDGDLFAAANFTKILFAAPPNPSILLLDAGGQRVMKFSPRLLELQTQLRPTTGGGNPVPAGVIGAVAVSPDHVLYIAVNGQVYFALNMP
jgi:hypothetical protein